MKTQEEEAGERFLDFVKILRGRIGMYVPAEDYSGVSSIILGFDLGSGARVLPAFQAWLNVEYGVPSNLSWISGVLHLAGVRTSRDTALTQNEQGEAIARLFELLLEYAEYRRQSS